VTFSEYQKLTAKTALYKKVPALKKLGQNYIYPVLGLVGEAGEVADKIKKLLRDSNGVATAEFKSDLTKELGDVLWYVSQTASEFKIALDKIASDNIEKLFSRKKRGALHGQGDNR
jgi:NTP pyrophosphatase (non-canonical NTP hydrolase)